MTATVLGVWESDWMEAERTERRLWKQTIQALGVDHWGMMPVKGGPFTSPLQYTTVAEMLAAYPGPKTFLIPAATYANGVSLIDYVHPEDAIYVFGAAHENLVAHITGQDTVVNIPTPVKTAMFGVSAMSMALYARLAQ